MKKFLLLISALALMLMGIKVYSQIPTTSFQYLFTSGSLTGLTHTGSALTSATDRINSTTDAVSLNGDYLRSANSQPESITISFWINTSTNDGNKRVIIEQSQRTSSADESNKIGWYAYLQNGKVALAANYLHTNTFNGPTVTYYTGYNYLVATSIVADGYWHHVAISAQKNIYFDGAGYVKSYAYKIYVDGALENSATIARGSQGSFTNISAALVGFSTPLTIANNNASNLPATSMYQDAIDDIRFYTSVVDATGLNALAKENRCELPENIQFDDISISGAGVSWESDPEVVSWDLIYVESGNAKETGTLVDGLTSNNYSLTGLNSSTSYDVYVKSNCTGFSGWYAIKSFTTACQSASVTATAKDIIIYLDNTGNAVLTAEDINDNSEDACGDPAILSIDINSFTCEHFGENTVTLTAGDSEGHTDAATAIVTVLPGVFTQDITVQLDQTGNVSIAATDVDNGTILGCDALTISIDKSSFDCSEIGPNTVTLTADDGNGNTATATAVVTVEDIVAPAMVVQNQSVTIAETGFVEITPEMIDNGSSDNCTGSLVFTLSKSQFTCNDLGENTVTLTATDENGNDSSVEAIVTVNTTIVDQVVTTSSSVSCPDGSDYTISMAGSTIGVNYYLRNNLTAIVDGPIEGTGSAIDFNTGAVNETSSFHVYAATTAKNSLDFDGFNDKITIPYTASMGLSSSFTVEAWIYPRATTYRRIFTNFSGTGNTRGDIILDNGSTTNNGQGLRFYLVRSNNTAASISIDNVLTLNAWNHVAATLNAGAMKLYVDGVEVQSGSLGETALSANTNSWVLGEDRGGTAAEFFDGRMDEVRVWNIARTTTQILETKDGCLDGDETGLILYYKFDDGTGSTTVQDHSVNENTGTLVDMNPATDWINNDGILCETNCGLQMSNEITFGDVESPTALAQDISVEINLSTGIAEVTPGMVDNGSSDACSSEVTMSISKSTFTCEDLGENAVTLTVTDASGNEASMDATITVSAPVLNQTLSSETQVCPGSSSVISMSGSEVGLNYYLKNSDTDATIDGPLAGTGSAIGFITNAINETTKFAVYAESTPEYSTLNFDGVNDKVNIPYNPSMALSGTFTIETWIYPRKTTYTRIFTNFSGSSTTPGDIVFDLAGTTNNGRALRLYITKSNGQAFSLTVDNVVTLNEWNHVAATFDAGAVKLIVNGAQVAAGSFGESTMPVNNNYWVLGEDRGGTTNEFFDGKMDEFRVWNVTRTSEQLQSSKDACLNGDEAGLILYYKFDNGAGSETVSDESSNDNTGTLSNMDVQSAWINGDGRICHTICSIRIGDEITISASDVVPPTALTQDLSVNLDNSGNATITSAMVNAGSNDNCTSEESLVLSIDITSFTETDLGPNTVTLIVTDLSGNEATASLTVTVLPFNQAPGIVSEAPDVTFDEDSPEQIIVTDINLLFSDPDGDELTFTVSSDNENVNPYISGNTIVVRSAENYSGTAFITITATDGVTPTEMEVMITVNAINDAPTVVNPVSDQTIDEDSFYSNTLSASIFSDVDGEQILITNVSFTESEWLSYNSETLTLSGTPTQSAVGQTTVTITGSDGVAATSTTFILTVVNVNDAPEVVAILNSVFDEDGAPVTFDLNDHFSDEDGQTLTYSISNPTDDILVVDRSVSGNELTITPLADAFGSVSFTINASDGALSTSLTVNVSVNPINDAPAVESGVADQSVNENSEFALTLPMNEFHDSDFDGLTISISFSAEWLSYNESTKTLSGVPQASDIGSHIISVSATDGQLSVTDEFSVTVLNVNEAPTALSLSNTMIQENAGTGQIVGTLTTSDPDNGDTFTYMLVGAGETNLDNTLFEIVSTEISTSLKLTGEADFEVKSSYSVNVRSTDSGGLTIDQIFTITVVDSEEPLGFAESVKLKIYPNPATDYVTVEGNELSRIEILDLTGTSMLQSTSRQIDLGGLKSGIYLLRVQSKDGKSITRKIVKN